jgi:hypothetical protein
MQTGYRVFPYRITKQSRLDFTVGAQQIALLARVAITPTALYIHSIRARIVSWRSLSVTGAYSFPL